MAFSESQKGLAAGFSAYLVWGLLPIYWKALKGVPASEILCHRIVWSCVFTIIVLALLKRGGEVLQAFKDKRTLLLLATSGTLVGTNWLTYIWGVNSGHVVECSLGYYINPLVNVLLGFIFFRDKLRTIQWISIALAVISVAIQIISFGKVPWIALILATTFGVYGLIRKVADVKPLPGLFVETSIISIPALFWLISLNAEGNGTAGSLDLLHIVLLVGTGVITSIPLMWFAYGAKRLRLVTLGILQYLAPTGMFLLGVFVYGETFNTHTLITFLFIWVGIVLYTVEGAMYYRKMTAQSRAKA